MDIIEFACIAQPQKMKSDVFLFFKGIIQDKNGEPAFCRNTIDLKY